MSKHPVSEVIRELQEDSAFLDMCVDDLKPYQDKDLDEIPDHLIEHLADNTDSWKIQEFLSFCRSRDTHETRRETE